jgi:hypothetical protein
MEKLLNFSSYREAWDNLSFEDAMLLDDEIANIINKYGKTPVEEAYKILKKEYNKNKTKK